MKKKRTTSTSASSSSSSSRRRPIKDYFQRIKNATANNLKNISISIPKNVFVCITGVAGSGKSSLIHKEFRKRNKKAICIDQSPVGQSDRSNTATYTGVFDIIRKEICQTQFRCKQFIIQLQLQGSMFQM